MSKIATYGLADSPLQLSDRLIGTEAPRPQPSVTPLATKNFSLGELLQLFSSNFPAASLQAVLNTGNTATQNITLTGTITSSVIKPEEIEDAVGSQGATFQFLSKASNGINWVDLPVVYPSLDEVLQQGATSSLIPIVGGIGLFDLGSVGYCSIFVDKKRFSFVDNISNTFAQIYQDNILLKGLNGYSFKIQKPSNISNNHTAFLQNTSGTIAYLGDIPTPISLTTLGDSGPATLIGSVLNIPQYSSGGGSAYTFSSPLSESLGVVSISQASTISDGYLSLSDFNTFNDKQDSITLTTTGSSGPSTFIANVLNIPEYTLSSLGGVPYIGATQNVNLGEYELKAGQIHFDQTPTGAAGVGIMRWNNTDGTVDLGLKGGNVTLQIGQENVVMVVNKSGSNLLESNYQCVRTRLVSEGGASGQRMAVVLAQANNDTNSATTLGIVTETINNNQEGFITVFGNVKEIDTTGSIQGETWVDGDILYLSPTIPGQLTNIKPSAPEHLITVGQVEYAHSQHGKIFVKVDNGYELDELHNVNIDSPVNNEVLTYNSSNQLWENKTIEEVTGAYKIKITSQSSAVTGTVAETQVLKVTIPANSLTLNEIINIPLIIMTKTGTAGTCEIRVKISTSSTMPSGNTDSIARYSSGASNLFAKMQRDFIIDNGTIKVYPLSSNTIDNTASTVAILTKAFDPTIVNYLYVSLQQSAAGDSSVLQGFYLTNQ